MDARAMSFFEASASKANAAGLSLWSPLEPPKNTGRLKKHEPPTGGLGWVAGFSSGWDGCCNDEPKPRNQSACSTNPKAPAPDAFWALEKGAFPQAPESGFFIGGRWAHRGHEP